MPPDRTKDRAPPRCRTRRCGVLFDRLLASDHSRQEPWGPLHAVVVACFLLQHPARMPPRDRPVYWALLHVYLAGGLPAVQKETARRVRLNSHCRNTRVPSDDLPPGTPEFPGVAPSLAWVVTIADVALDGSFPARGHAERVAQWARATVDAGVTSGTDTAGSAILPSWPEPRPDADIRGNGRSWCRGVEYEAVSADDSCSLQALYPFGSHGICLLLFR
ncbi:DUF5946 family protein [Streptomyces klenkii]|uniref:DUF5946 family protein n=1 Tax=Streptomyces klenkii TaxID=1420899 RepID=UPI0033D54E79